MFFSSIPATLPRTVCVLLLTLLGLAQQAGASVQTNWMCWLHADSMQAVCTVAGTTQWAAAAVAPAASSAPDLVKTLREHPHALAGKKVFVPLHGVPFDSASVALLMRAVLCGSQTDCAARYHADIGPLVAQAPELFADMEDPLLEASAL